MSVLLVESVRFSRGVVRPVESIECLGGRGVVDGRLTAGMIVLSRSSPASSLLQTTELQKNVCALLLCLVGGFSHVRDIEQRQDST